jgi:uncharacterized protein YjaZ
MKRQILIFYIITLASLNLTATKIYTSDLTNFWTAYDSVISTSNNNLKIKFITDLYINKASKGLNEFINARNLTAEDWVNSINKYPKFWVSIRPKTLSVLKYQNEIERALKEFKKQYPNFKQPDIYFTIGCLKTGGTTSKDQILIGTEIATGDSTVDSSELIPFFQKYFKHNNNIIQLVTHEMNHTQQQLELPQNPTLLAKCIMEGSCDFIAEIILNNLYNAVYIEYGEKNKLELLKKVTVDADKLEYSDWMYNYNTTTNVPADLGYFIGYTIAKEYYNNSKNKKKAIKDIIELNWLDNNKMSELLSLAKKKNGL